MAVLQLTEEEIGALVATGRLQWPFALPQRDIPSARQVVETGVRVLVVRSLASAGEDDSVVLAEPLASVVRDINQATDILELRLGGVEDGYAGVVTLLAFLRSDDGTGMSVVPTPLSTYGVSRESWADMAPVWERAITQAMTQGTPEEPGGFVVRRNIDHATTVTLWPGAIRVNGGEVRSLSTGNWDDVLMLLGW